MGLRINNNVEAQNALRQLNINQMSFSKSMQRLSSGKRINSAADDAAGYAISNKLNAQAKGLDQASANAQDGISMIQTAAGGLQTTQDLLQRFRQLAVQSANDTNTTSDRTQLQSEADQISNEITQIASTTQFNTKNLLDGAQATSGSGFTGGSAGSGTFTNFASGVTASTLTASGIGNGSTTATINNVTSTTTDGSAGSLTINGKAYGLDATYTAGTAAVTGTAGTYSGAALTGGTGATVLSAGTFSAAGLTGNGSLSITGLTAPTSNVTNGGAGSLTIGGTTYGLNATVTAATSSTHGSIAYSLVTSSGAALSGGQSLSFTLDSGANNTAVGVGAGASLSFTESGYVASSPAAHGTVAYALHNGPTGASFALTLDSGSNGTNVAFGSGQTSGTVAWTQSGATAQPVTGGVTLQVGANQDQNLNVSISAMDSYSLGVSATGTGNAAAVYAADGTQTSAAKTTGALDITTQAHANAAIKTIDAAINAVSTQAASLGAVQNRLSAAMSNLAIGSENMTAAYSNITNVNMAQESTSLATAQILQQSATAMLAQANQAPQGVLKLLG